MKIKISMLMGFLFTLILFLFLIWPNRGGSALISDNEKENAYTCQWGYHVSIYCTEGTIDCQPRNCP
jgi:hypothetical protein